MSYQSNPLVHKDDPGSTATSINALLEMMRETAIHEMQTPPSMSSLDVRPIFLALVHDAVEQLGEMGDVYKCGLPLNQELEQEVES